MQVCIVQCSMFSTMQVLFVCEEVLSNIYSICFYSMISCNNYMVASSSNSHSLAANM